MNQPGEMFAWQSSRISADRFKLKALTVLNVLSKAAFDGRPIAPKWENISEANQQWGAVGLRYA